MHFLYSIAYSLGFILMLPAFLMNRQKYASGFSQRLGNCPEFKHDGRKVIWLHCVSVGETNAARPLVDKLREEFPDHRLVVSTTTKTGQDLANKIFEAKVDAIVFFPFDWKFSVRKALANYKPTLVLLMETEIWPRFIRESKRSGAKVAIVNGRLSENSFRRYSKIRSFISRVLADVDLVLMQGEADAKRIQELGLDEGKVTVTGNLKFETSSANPDDLTEQFRERFEFTAEKPLIIAASTHHPEERWIIESLKGVLGESCRLMIVPRHPERFDEVEKLLNGLSFSFVRRSSLPSNLDRTADIVLLDSIGELNAAYPHAEIVFVGGSLVSHGGQSIIEPAVHGKAIVTGPYTMNFEAVVREFAEFDAIVQTQVIRQEDGITARLQDVFSDLLSDDERRRILGRNAADVVGRSNRDASQLTVESLKRLLASYEIGAR